MKIKNTLFIVLAIAFSFASTNAEYRIYSTQSEFEEAKWAVCEAATDGCNNYIVSDWKVTAWTRKMCLNHTPEWNCTKYKENVITTKSLPVTTTWIDYETTSSKPTICTMQYAPVCGINWKVYWNSCMANGAGVEIAYTWECIVKELSTNDENLYNTIVNRLDTKIQDQINELVSNYLLLINKYTSDKQEKINKLMIEKIDWKVFEILSRNPQDIALSDSENSKYLRYKLLQLELKKITFKK